MNFGLVEFKRKSGSYLPLIANNDFLAQTTSLRGIIPSRQVVSSGDFCGVKHYFCAEHPFQRLYLKR